MNLTVAYLGEGTAAGPVDLWFFRPGTGKELGQRHGYKVAMIADIFHVASLVNLALISLERLHATLYPIEHFLVGRRIYYKKLFLSWFMDLILTSILSVIRLNDAVGRSVHLDNLHSSYPCSAHNILCHYYFKSKKKTFCTSVRVSYHSRKKTFSNFIYS